MFLSLLAEGCTYLAIDVVLLVRQDHRNNVQRLLGASLQRHFLGVFQAPLDNVEDVRRGRKAVPAHHNLVLEPVPVVVVNGAGGDLEILVALEPGLEQLDEGGFDRV